MSKLTLSQQAERFFKSGMKQRWFTNDLYEAFYIYSNLFIAHFDKSGFYKQRFQNASGLQQTIELLNTNPKNETHALLQKTCRRWSWKNEAVLTQRGINSLYASIDNMKSGFAFITDNNDRQEAWDYLKALEAAVERLGA